jgi:hypothetical protein
MDIEYLGLLEKLIEKKEREYGDGWAKSWDVIRKQTTNTFEYWYNKYGREVAIEKIEYYLSK